MAAQRVAGHPGTEAPVERPRSLLADGSPSTVATWYLWLGSARLMFSMNQDGFRERNLARDGRVALTVLGEDW